jgi:hypothetical protein
MGKCVTYRILLLCLLLTTIVSCADEQFYGYPPHQPTFQGLTFLAKDTNDFTKAVQSNRFSQMKQQTFSNTIVLSFYIYQENEFSTSIEANTTGINPITNSAVFPTTSDTDLKIAISAAKTLGMNVVLNPILKLYNGKSSRYIPFSDAWYTSYKDLMRKYAVISQESGVTIFCIGNELSSAINDESAPKWKELINEVRLHYTKYVVYSASWQGLEGYKNNEPEFFWCPIYTVTDYIAFQAFPLLTSNGQTHGTFWGSETNRMQSVRSFLEQQYHENGKKFLIMQTGLQSQLGAELEPHIERDVATSKRFPHEGIQELYYTYIIESFGKHPLCDGIFFWYWDCTVQQESFIKGSYSPENKVAATVLKQWFSS